MSAGQIVGEHARRQSELGGVGALDDFLLILELQDRHHGTENLFAHDGHVVAAIVEHGGCHEVSLPELARRHAHAARQDARTLGAPAVYVVEHLVHVLLGHQRAHLRLRVHGVADSHRAHALDEAFQKRRPDRAMHEHPRAVGAHLSG